MTNPKPHQASMTAPSSPAMITQLIQQAIHRTAALQSVETGWQAVKLQQTQALLTKTLESVQFIVDADPEWEDLLRDSTKPGTATTTEDSNTETRHSS